MRHNVGFNSLSRNHQERKALKRSLVTSLFKYERIQTTRAKAKAIQPMAERLITRAKVDSVHNRRQAARIIFEESVVSKLFNDIAPLFSERKGGYTRILKVGYRNGDAAEMVILELVDKTAKAEKKDEKKSKRDLKKAEARKKAKEEKKAQEA